MRRFYFTLLASMVAVVAGAAGPNGSGTYYQAANGKKGAALKTALCGVIYNRTEQQSYNGLWSAFFKTDVRSDGKIWDMYSNITNYTPVTSGSNYSVEGDCYNREHSFPQSWFGSNAPMYTDLHHIYPTDGKVNGMRSNYPFGETNGEKYKSANDFSKLGACTYPGYTGVVFEPNDMYKGDFARTYFYMVTCYEEKLHDWVNNYGSSTEVDDVLDGTTYPGLTTWQLNMLLEWAAADPVSEKEVRRNHVVDSIQGNRNPFIDYPGLEQYIWGSKTDVAFSYDNYEGSGVAKTYKLEQVTSVEAGGMYVFEQGGYVMNNTCSSSALQTTNTYNTIGLTGEETYVWTLETATSGYYMKNAKAGAQAYLNNTGSTSLAFGTKSSIWAFNFQEDETVLIQCTTASNRYLGYTNSTSHAYKAYDVGNMSYPHAIKVYQLVEETSSLTSSDLALTGAPIALNFDLYNNSSAQTVSFTTSGTGAVTVGESEYVMTSISGNTITVTPVKVTPSAQTIIVSQAADETHAAGSATFTVTVTDSTPAPVGGGGYFTKITSMDDFESGGTYLIVYETGGKAFDGSLTTLDAVSNNIDVTISDGMIEATPTVMASTFTFLAKSGGYSIKATSGKYIGNTSDENYLRCSDSDLYTNSIMFGKYDGNVYIQSSKSYLCYNKSSGQTRFRYFKSATYTNQESIQLYKYIPPTSESVTVGDVGYATYCSEYALDFEGTGIAAYVGTLNGTALTFTPVSQVPAGTGLLLVASGGKTADVPVISSADAVEENCLTGVNVATTLDANDYILNVKNGAAGFYKAGEFTALDAHKAYIPALAGNGVKGFAIYLEDDPTGIADLNANVNLNDAIYNAAGQRLSRMQKGLNIVNGKKILK